MHYPTLIRWVVLTLVLLSSHFVMAQDSVTETPTVTEIPTETPTFTEAATFTATPTAAPEVTVEVTDEVVETTDEPVEVTEEAPEATVEIQPSATFTAEPTVATLAPEPPLTLLASDTFDSGDLTNWSLGSGWLVVTSEVGQALQVFNSTEAATFSAYTGLNTAAQVRMKLDATTTVRLGIRQNETGGYAVTLDPAGQVVLLRANTPVSVAVVAPSLEWRTLRLAAIDNGVRVSVDGVEVIAVRDDAPLPPGTVNFSAIYADATSDHTLLVDDFALWVPTAEVPASTVEPTATATEMPAMPTLTSEATATVVEAELIDTGEPRPIVAIPLTVGSVSAAPPNNDNFSTALAASLAIYSGSTFDATLEMGELGGSGNLPTCAYRQYPANGLFYNYITHTAWYRFTAPAAAEYNITTAGSSFDTVLGVYSGAAVNALTELACHDGYTSSNGTSTLNVALTEGQVVSIQVGGFYGSKHGWFGPYKLQIKANVPVPARTSLVSPTNGSYIDDQTPELIWNPAVGALDYEVQISTSSRFPVPLTYNVSELTGTSHTVGTSLTPGTYYWRGRGENLNEQAGSWSSTYRFTVGILRSPSAAAIFTTASSVTPTFRWYTPPGATSYQLQIDDNTGFSSPTSYDTGMATSFTLPLTDALTAGNYYWRVNHNGGISTIYRAFTVSPGAPAVPVITSPTERQFTNLTSILIQWGAADGAATYHIQVDDTSNFSSPLADVTGLSNTNYTFNTTTEKLYYARVRSLSNLGVPGKWSRGRSFTLDTTLPPAPALSSPTAGGTTNDTTPRVLWQATPGANFYRIQIDNDINFGSPEEDFQGSSTSFTRLTPLNQGTWYWRVRSRDAAGNWSALWSATRTFMVTIMKSPAHRTIFTTSTTVRPTFSWYALPGASAYHLQVDNNSDFSSPLVNPMNMPVTSYALTTAEALSPGVYYWRVHTNLNQSPVTWTFTVSPAAPSAPVIASPTQDQRVDDSTPTANWNIVAGVSSYEIQIDDNSNFASPLMTVASLISPTHTFSTLGDGLYHIRVRSFNGYGVPGKWSSTRRFTVDTLPPDAPGLRSPTNEDFTSSLQPKFSWNAAAGGPSRYEIQISFNTSFTGASLQTFSTTRRDFTPGTALLYRTYYWRVRAFDALEHASEWSEMWSITVAPATSIAPNLNRYTTATPTLTWAAVSNAQAYQIQVDDSTRFTSLNYSNNALDGDTTSVTLSALSNGRWYWRIRVQDAYGNWSNWSSMQTFVIEAG